MTDGLRDAPLVAFTSFRLGGADGVSVAAESWMRCFRELGWSVATVSGDANSDRPVRGLGRPADGVPDPRELRAAFADADLVVVENAFTIPMHLDASHALAEVLRGRPAIVRHFDPPWHRPRFAHVDTLPVDDPAWRHVGGSRMTTDQLISRGIEARCIYGMFEAGPAGGGADVRRHLGVSEGERLFLHPVRAIARKDIDTAVGIAEHFRATYWLTGPPEEDYELDVRNILASARTRVIWRPFDDMGIDAAYDAADLVLFPSLWEGFGNPPVEAAMRRRPVVVGNYPVAGELRQLGFDWPGPEDLDRVGEVLGHGSQRRDLVEHNHDVASQHFSVRAVIEQLSELISSFGPSVDCASGPRRAVGVT